MPQALTNTNISATYKGVLHTNGTSLPTTGQEIVSDGTGFVSALSVGRLNQGATVSGALSATDVYAGQLKMPNTNGSVGQVVSLTSAGVLGLKSLSELITGESAPVLSNGVYYNPKITVLDNVIVNIESRPAVEMLATPQVLIPSTVYNAGVSPSPFIINWSTANSIPRPGYTADARYAIITVRLAIRSIWISFSNSLSMDGEIIGDTIIAQNITSDYRLLDENVYSYTNQLIVKLPAVNILTAQRPNSTFLYSSTVQSYNNTDLRTSGRGPNNHSVDVKLNGWIF